MKICFDQIAGHSKVSLNGSPLGDIDFGDSHFDVSGKLEKRNDLRVQIIVTAEDLVENKQPDGFGLVGEVRLEIG